MHPGAVPALAILVAAVLVDWFVGEYPLPLHPVVWMGKVIAVGVWLAPRRGWWRQFLYGVFLAAGVAGLSVGLTLLVLRWAAPFPMLTIVVATFLLKASFALRELGRAADGVLRPLTEGDLPRAREALRSLCSRDPSNLGEQELLAAAVESVAENASDSFIAPLFYYLFFGVAGAVGYRAVNTLDAMVGYRGRFEALGKASARLDDLANYLPARLTAGLLLLVGWLLGNDAAEGWRILRRDGASTPSPNAGRPMSVMAGLLGVELEKKGVYVLGDPRQPLTSATVREAWRIVAWAGQVMLALCGLAILASQARWR